MNEIRNLFGIENECLTATDNSTSLKSAVSSLFEEMQQLAPSLPCPNGFFNGYGRVYLDGGRHLELASAECDCPYLLAELVERQQRLLTVALARCSKKGHRLVLANNNHDGLLHGRAATWGAHENYLVDSPPGELADRLLPFLVSRIYAGAGGVLAPTGEFIACVRHLFARTDVGGDTMAERAVFSTCRDEHLMGSHSSQYRLHLILGDGHRSQFSIALQIGCTALVLKAAQEDPGLLRSVPGLVGARRRTLWLEALRMFNRPALPGEPLRTHPLAIRIQRIYLDKVCRWADQHPRLPAWVNRLLVDWTQTLNKFATDDFDWLAARLDPWIKHRLYTNWLESRGYGWRDVARVPGLLEGLTLLDQRYHEFASPDSPFAALDAGGMLQHRVAPLVNPGAEPEPFVPETTTRARARARFLSKYGGSSTLTMNWDAVYNHRTGTQFGLFDPFAIEYSHQK